MYQSSPGSIRVNARLELSTANVELHHVTLTEDIEAAIPVSEEYRVDYCINSRTPEARLSYPDRWPSHRFEEPGSLYMVPPLEQVRARSKAGTNDVVVCMLQPTAITQWFDSGIEWNGKQLDATMDIQNVNVRRLMMSIANELRSPGLASQALCEAMTVQLAIELARHFQDLTLKGGGTLLPGWKLNIIDDRLNDLSSIPTLPELAELCGMSVRHLTRGFRETRLCTIGEYIHNRRIAMAQHLLSRGESVKVIAHRLGFNSPSSFSYAFRKSTGFKPRAYRAVCVSESMDADASAH